MNRLTTDGPRGQSGPKDRAAQKTGLGRLTMGEESQIASETMRSDADYELMTGDQRHNFNVVEQTSDQHPATSNQSAPPADQSAGPIPGRERIEVVDILRGFAIFGILLVNMYAFAGMTLTPQNYTGLDKVIIILIILLAQAKFYSLFSFLFGWGMWIQMSRAAAKGLNFVPVYIRRMLILLAIGVLHGIFIWTGDILTLYAVLGLLLLLFRNSSERTLLFAATLLLLLPIVVNLPGDVMNGFRESYAELTDFLRTFGPDSDSVYGSGTYMEITARRFQSFVGGQTWFIYWVGNVFAMFILGFYAGKRGYFGDIRGNLPVFRRALWISLVVGLLFSVLSVLVTIQQDLVSPEWQRFVRISTRTIGAPALMLFYVSAITLLSQRETWLNRLGQLAPVGRMALTNYLLQSLIVTLIFYSYGLGLYGEIGPTFGLIITILVYTGQIRFSAWWLERYRFGPMEWLWRSLTYGRRQPIRRGESYTEPRPLPGVDKFRRLASRVHPLIYLVIVWIGLAIWTISLLQWQARLTSEVYEDPFVAIDGDEETFDPGEPLAANPTVSETDERVLDSGAIMPRVHPAAYDPSPIAASGDMRALALTFDSEEAIGHIKALSQPAFSGRLAGSSGGRAAGDHIAERMAEYGLQPAGENGTFFQPFSITYTLLLEVPELSITGPDGSVSTEYVLHEDYSPIISGYAGGGEGSGEVVWVNMCLPEDFVDLDVVGKIILCRASTSSDELAASGRNAIEYGADGLLFLIDPERRPADFGNRYKEVWVPESLPVLFVYPEVVTDLFEGNGLSPTQLDEDSDPFPLGTRAHLKVTTSEAVVVEARNVLGVLPGRDPEHVDEVVIVGGHYDHLGQGPDGTYWPGANDNASGVAAMLEVARNWQEQGFVPRRTVLFAAWDAEEWGLIGSTTYVFRPSYPLEDTIATIQMDMVGAGSETLNIGGDPSLAGQLRAIAESMDVEATVTDLGRSDHVPFNMAGVPSSLLIWLSEDEVIPHYHRPADQPAVIDSDKLSAVGMVAETALLDLAESEPEILNLLANRATAALARDLEAFLETTRSDQVNVDENWFTDLQSLAPTAAKFSVDDLKIMADTAAGDVRIQIEYPDPASSDGVGFVFADLPVEFSRDETGWAWAGPSLTWAEPPEEESDDSDRVIIAVAYPTEVNSNLWQTAVEATSRYEEISSLLGLTSESESTILLFPDAKAIRASTGLSLPPDKDRWVAQGLLKLVYSDNISQSVEFDDAIAQLVLANAGVTEEAAPWLWQGLPLALQAERELVSTHSQQLPTLQKILAGEIPHTGPAGRWAAVEYLRERVGWDGLGRFIIELGQECHRDLCADVTGQDAVLQRTIQMDSESFTSAWQDHWRRRLDNIQAGVDEILVLRSEAVLSGDEQTFLNTVDPTDRGLVQAEENWFADLFRHPVESFSLSASPAALLPNGDVLADVIMDFRLQGGGDNSINLSTLFRRNVSGYLWAGASKETITGSLISVRYPEGKEVLAQALLENGESIYAELGSNLGIDQPEPMSIDLFADYDSFRSAIALSFPNSDWIRGWSSPGTGIQLRVLPVSTPADYRSELAIQLARQLLHQIGVYQEWLLKGVSIFLARSFDGGLTQRVMAGSLDNLAEAAAENRLFDLSDLPIDAGTLEVSYELARVQAWDSVRYLVATFGWDALLGLIHEQGTGAGLETAMRATTGESISSFGDSWVASLARGHMPDVATDIVSRFDGEIAYAHVEQLASPELAGRLAGTEGGEAAAEYVADKFEEYGLLPAGDISGGSFMQTFLITTTSWMVDPYFEVIGDPQPYVLREDVLFSRATTGKHDLVFGELVWVEDSAPFDTDLSGKIMVALPADNLASQIRQAVEFGAEGLILLGLKDEIEELYVKKPLDFASTAEIPVLELTKFGTLRLLETSGYSYQQLSQIPDVEPLGLFARMGATYDQPARIPTANVLGYLPGSDPYLSEEVVILGAHYDHVGDDPPVLLCPDGASDGIDKSGDCETAPGERYSGANDNASGVGVLLEIVRIWHESGYRPKRSVLFAGWGAQEYGQLGSQHYIMTPTLALTNTMAMVQLDGMGGGDGFAPGIQGNPVRDALLLYHARKASVQLDEKITETGQISESDHFTFSELGMPVLLFNWRLADENNLSDTHTNGVQPVRLEVTGRLAALTMMMLTQ